MLRLGLLLIVVAGIALAATNPGADDHKLVVYRRLPNHLGTEGILADLAGEVLGRFDLLPMKYNNYFFFSTTTFRGDVVSVGGLTRVWATRAEILPAGE